MLLLGKEISTGWLIGCFGFHGPLRQYFSQNRAVSLERVRKREMTDERKCPTNPHPHPVQAQEAHALLVSKLVGRPGTGSFTPHHRTTRPDRPTISTGLRLRLDVFAPVKAHFYVTCMLVLVLLLCLLSPV